MIDRSALRDFEVLADLPLHHKSAASDSPAVRFGISDIQHVTLVEGPGHVESTTPANFLLHPLNTILLGLVVYVGYQLFKPTPPASLPKAEPPTVFRTFTPHTLLENNGTNGRPIYLAIRGRDLDAPLDNLEGLGAEDMETLSGWEESFSGNYPVIGKLVSVEEYKTLQK
ncbi:unnamed protein product [Parascedosporium putredinis]|uniref:Uncharacterized protein n=1 Tax=Parascedosporium putredinis TaxID=1442378 RepID=A0A9P1GXU7_9PEZI|nr:unnamed protein product [Parascedosporium putredinis]CAI7989364.1 unnamed protein product [Parascedosporium putredinis]